MERGRQLTEATDIFIYLVSNFGAKEGGGDKPDSKPNIGEASRARLETVDSAEDVFRGETRVRWIVLCFVKGGGQLTSKSCKHQVIDA